MSKKEILKPFDLAKAKQGAKLRTDDGRDARIVCYDLRTRLGEKMSVAVKDSDGYETTWIYPLNGVYSPSPQLTLNIVEEVEESDRWLDQMGGKVKGWCLSYKGEAVRASSSGKEKNCWKSIFAEKKQAQAALAAAQISQIMANDERFGGVITDEEWASDSVTKYVICRHKGRLRYCYLEDLPPFTLLAFHTAEQRNLFMQDNEKLIRQYYML